MDRTVRTLEQIGTAFLECFNDFDIEVSDRKVRKGRLTATLEAERVGKQYIMTANYEVIDIVEQTLAFYLVNVKINMPAFKQITGGKYKGSFQTTITVTWDGYRKLLDKKSIGDALDEYGESQVIYADGNERLYILSGNHPIYVEIEVIRKVHWASSYEDASHESEMN